MKSVLWNAIAIALIVTATVGSFVEYQSGTLHNDGLSVLWNGPD